MPDEKEEGALDVSMWIDLVYMGNCLGEEAREDGERERWKGSA